ncbi:hypothetical protein CEXT_528381 [Caerostris extrusa]|uniref:Uncharacterized protein n=1 Tax=Caerostris extrusa TaxID=172846 RepID=A0AAV4PR09_CAEEX|nr:hypothetical protein CEXT_528381 [Caerostris extrusa]
MNSPEEVQLADLDENNNTGNESNSNRDLSRNICGPNYASGDGPEIITVRDDEDSASVTSIDSEDNSNEEFSDSKKKLGRITLVGSRKHILLPQ